MKQRILDTLKFFDLQDYPLTLLELHRFLIADVENLKHQVDGQGEIIISNNKIQAEASIDKILQCLDSECGQEVKNTLGFYHLANPDATVGASRKQIVQTRLDNYFFGIQREKLIKRYIRGLKYIPFVRGAALAGSQAMGQEKESSDIDLLIITDPKFMWLARTLVTAYFQILGKRRHGAKIKNRFCLNHYLAGPKKIAQLRNLYTASEYLKLRPLLGAAVIRRFQQNNPWINQFFPLSNSMELESGGQSLLQEFLEKFLGGNFGQWLENALKNWQLPKIRREKFIVVEDDELSFHPESKQQELLQKFLFE